MIYEVVQVKRIHTKIEAENHFDAAIIAANSLEEGFELDGIHEIKSEEHDRAVNILITKSGLKVPDLSYEDWEQRVQDEEEERERYEEYINQERDSQR